MLKCDGVPARAGKDVPAGTMAVVRSPDFLRALIRETALATRKPGIREQNLPTADLSHTGLCATRINISSRALRLGQTRRNRFAGRIEASRAARTRALRKIHRQTIDDCARRIFDGHSIRARRGIDVCYAKRTEASWRSFDRREAIGSRPVIVRSKGDRGSVAKTKREALVALTCVIPVERFVGDARGQTSDRIDSEISICTRH